MAGLRGKVFGGYQLVEQLGGTGFAEVYRGAPAHGVGRDVVVKIVYPEFARQPGFLPNFRRIVEFSSQLVNHPHILPLIGSGEEQGYLFLVSPFVAGGTLRDWLQQGQRLSTTDAAPFFRQLCGALAYAHSRGIVHSNLKPSNVYLFEGRHVLVGDFGLLWDMAHLDMDHTGSGTEAVEYLAPEAFSGTTSPLTDIYGLGGLLFATLTGRPPFTGARLRDVYTAHLHQPAPHLSQVDPSLQPSVLALDAVTQRALAKRPEDRFGSALLLAQAIEEAVAHAPAAAESVWSAPVAQPPAHPHLAGAFPGGIASQMAVPAAAAGGQLGQLFPPFPPLAGSQTVDGSMESQRTAQADLAGSPPSVGPASNLEFPHTMHMAAPVSPMGAQADTLQPTAPASDQLSPYGDNFRQPMEKPSAPLLGGSPLSAPLGDDRFDQGANARLAALDAPIERPPVAAQPPLRTPSEVSQPRFGRQPFSTEMPAIRLPPQSRQQEQPDGWLPSGDFGSGPAVHERDLPPAPQGGFSPTSLDLPHLTAPKLRGEMPTDWDAPDMHQGQGRASRPPFDSYQASEPNRRSAWPRSDVPRYPSTPSYPAFGTSGIQGGPPSHGWRGASAPSDPLGHSLPRVGQETSAHDRKDTFADQRVWTVGMTAVRHRRKWLRPLLVCLLVLFVVDFSLLVVARPDLCPNTRCVALGQSARTFMKQTLHLGGSGAAKLSVTPATVHIHTVAGGNASATVQVTNSGSDSATWQATSSLLWVTPTPSSGTLAPGSTAAISVVAQPQGVPPKTYNATLTITTGSVTTSVPLAIDIGVGPQLAVTPATLRFTGCGVSQQITITNSGGGPLAFTASPSQSDALILDVTNGNLDPGQSRTANVTLTCQAQYGSDYAVILVSNGGSTQVRVHYGF